MIDQAFSLLAPLNPFNCQSPKSNRGSCKNNGKPPRVPPKPTIRKTSSIRHGLNRITEIQKAQLTAPQHFPASLCTRVHAPNLSMEPPHNFSELEKHLKRELPSLTLSLENIPKDDEQLFEELTLIYQKHSLPLVDHYVLAIIIQHAYLHCFEVNTLMKSDVLLLPGKIPLASLSKELLNKHHDSSALWKAAREQLELPTLSHFRYFFEKGLVTWKQFLNLIEGSPAFEERGLAKFLDKKNQLPKKLVL